MKKLPTGYWQKITCKSENIRGRQSWRSVSIPSSESYVSLPGGGTKRIEELNTGDEILTDTGEFAKIVSIG